MKIRTAHQWLALLLAGALLGACGGQQEPAQKAIDNAEAAIAAIREDAAKFVPDDLKGLEDSLQGMKDNYAKGNYPAVLTASRELNTRIASVTETVSQKKDEMQSMTEQLTEQWNTLSVEVPEMVEAVTARVDSITKTGKLPKDLDAAAFERVKTESATMAQSWQQALGAFSNGNMQEAVDMALVAKDKANTLRSWLKMDATS
jgi:hypothetical protein